MMSQYTDLLPGVPPFESPLFRALLPELDLNEDELELAKQLHTRGYAVIDFPDADIENRVDRIKHNLAPLYSVDLEDPDSIKARGNQRIQDAWTFDEDVRSIATNSKMLDLLSRLYNRRAFPFQTLNFPVGTQQHMHSDAIHFSSLPERFMCGVWLAMEDVHPDAGPLAYYPGTQAWPILSNVMLGAARFGDNSHLAQEPYERIWRAMVDAQGIQPEMFLARKGQALIWAANLLHGGSAQKDPQRTRWSQVTHYYFEDCVYYTPAFSEEPLGRLDLRNIVDISTGQTMSNKLFDKEVSMPCQSKTKAKRGWRRLFKRAKHVPEERLPKDFDPELYFKLNPDVAASGEQAGAHYQRHGLREGRRYRL